LRVNLYHKIKRIRLRVYIKESILKNRFSRINPPDKEYLGICHLYFEDLWRDLLEANP